MAAKNKISFYLQNKNSLFDSDILAICYKADSKEIEEYGLTSPNILLLVRNEKISDLKGKKNCNYYEEIKKMFENKKIILRIQSECLLGMYGDSHCDCESQRQDSIKIIAEKGGIYIHLPQEAQGWGLFYKLKELELQVSGRTQSGEYIGKKDRNSAQEIILGTQSFKDNRSYQIVYKILDELSLSDNAFLVITESDKKIEELNKSGLKSSKYSNDILSKINSENVSEYLIKIKDGTHEYDSEIIDSIIKIIEDGNYNERTLITFISLIDKIKNKEPLKLSDEFKNKFIELYDNMICGDEKRYIIGDENKIKIQNNFSCKVDSTIFKTLCEIYGKNIFDRISMEEIHYFINNNDETSVRIRKSYIIDNIENICSMFSGQTYLSESLYDSVKKRVIQKEVTSSSLKSYFENPNYSYQKKVEMVTIISENIIPGVNIYIKRIPNVENRVMDLFGKKDDIRNMINAINSVNGGTLLNIISDRELSEQNFSLYNSVFADKEEAIEEEKNMYTLTKESELDGVRSKVLQRSRKIK